jgi:hypothetical protein
MPLGALVLGSIYVRSTLIFSTVAVLLLIPSYFGPPNFFLDERIHLTQNTYYELTKAVDASGLASFSWDGEFKHEGGVFASALPLLKTLINQRQVSGNAYVSHKELLAEIYDHDTKVICVPKDNELDSQILNLVLQIEYGVSLHQLTQLQIC